MVEPVYVPQSTGYASQLLIRRSLVLTSEEVIMSISHGTAGETCAQAIRASLRPGEIVRFTVLVERVKKRGCWKDETIWQNLMGCVVNLPPARLHWSHVPFLFVHGDGRYELYDERRHPAVVD